MDIHVSVADAPRAVADRLGGDRFGRVGRLGLVASPFLGATGKVDLEFIVLDDGRDDLPTDALAAVEYATRIIREDFPELLKARGFRIGAEER